PVLADARAAGIGQRHVDDGVVGAAAAVPGVGKAVDGEAVGVGVLGQVLERHRVVAGAGGQVEILDVLEAGAVGERRLGGRHGVEGQRDGGGYGGKIEGQCVD